MKNNKKKNRTDGAIYSNNEKYATPLKSNNSPLSYYEFTDAEKIEIQSRQNNKY